MTMPQIAGCVGLLAFGFVYNAIVAEVGRWGMDDFQARFVAVGCATIIVVLAVTNWQTAYTGREWLVLMMLYFACGGLGMGLGSWQRRKQVAL
jgi:hypothetical protein